MMFTLRKQPAGPTILPLNLADDTNFFKEHGYLIVRGAFTGDEMGIIKQAILTNDAMNRQSEHIRQAEKGSGFETLFVWNDTGGDDLFAKATRNFQIFDRLRTFFADDVYVYHNKITLKYPGVQGFRYHQDYFYWYGMGNLFPDMATASIAVDPSTRENGCLKVLDGSHKLGRIDHDLDDGLKDTGANLERLKVVKDRCEEVFIELAVGDVVIFHCNTLHGSDDNNSTTSRISLLGCYNTKHNDPYMATPCGCPFYSEQSSVVERIRPEDANKMPDFGLMVASKD